MTVLCVQNSLDVDKVILHGKTLHRGEAGTRRERRRNIERERGSERDEEGVLQGALGGSTSSPRREPCDRERDFFIDNLLVRIPFIIVMIGWTGLAPWEFEFPFPGSPTVTFLVGGSMHPHSSEDPSGKRFLPRALEPSACTRVGPLWEGYHESERY